MVPLRNFRVMRSIPLALLISAGISCGQVPSPPDPDDAAYPAIERYIQVLESVRKEHPDAGKVAYDRLVNHSLEGMLSSLDPFSMFIHPEMAAMNDGKVDPHVPSLGLSLGVRDDGPYLAGIDIHGPAASAGLLAGSAVLKINGEDPKDVPWQELLDRLKRPPGEVTKLLVKSTDAPKPKEISLTHITVETRSLAESKLLENDKAVGYLRLAQFGGGCAKEVEAALDDLEDQGMKSLIFDLRGNPGGNLDETVCILGLFLPPSTPVVTTKGREGLIGEALKTPDRQRRKREYPITILIDRMSASASELTAGALQDLKRAKIIGETSYGKGSVQKIVPMGGGTSLRLTFAKYYTPADRTPHGVGIIPDVEIPLNDDDRACFELFRRKNSLKPEEASRLAAWKDPVMTKALEGK